MFKKLLSLIAIFALTITDYSYSFFWDGQANLVLIKNESNESVVIQSNARKWANTTTDEAGAVYDHWNKPFSIAPGATLKCSNFIIPWNIRGESIFVNVAGKRYDIHDITFGDNLPLSRMKEWYEKKWHGSKIDRKQSLPPLFIKKSIRVIEGSKIWDFVISCQEHTMLLEPPAVCPDRTKKYNENKLNVAIIIKGNAFIEIREVKSDGTIESDQPGLESR